MKWMLIFAVTTSMLGCAGAQKVISDAANVMATIAADAREVEHWVDFIADAADEFFRRVPSPDAEKKFRDARQAVKLAVIGLEKAAGAAKSLDDAEYLRALAELKETFEAFLASAKSIGVVGQRNTMSAARAGGARQVVEVPRLKLLETGR